MNTENLNMFMRSESFAISFAMRSCVYAWNILYAFVVHRKKIMHDILMLLFGYTISILAPTASNCLAYSSASSFVRSSLTSAGALSTKDLACRDKILTKWWKLKFVYMTCTKQPALIQQQNASQVSQQDSNQRNAHPWVSNPSSFGFPWWSSLWHLARKILAALRKWFSLPSVPPLVRLVHCFADLRRTSDEKYRGAPAWSVMSQCKGGACWYMCARSRRQIDGTKRRRRSHILNGAGFYTIKASTAYYAYNLPPVSIVPAHWTPWGWAS